MKKVVWFIVLIVSLVFLLAPASSDAENMNEIETNESDAFDPWGEKAFMHYLFWTVDEKLENDVLQLQKKLAITDQQLEDLKDVALTEFLALQDINQKQGPQSEPSVEMREVFHQTENGIMEALDDNQYALFRNWVAEWWSEEVEYRKDWREEQLNDGEPTADREWVAVLATQYHGNQDREIALPDKYIKYANLAPGWPTPPPQYNNPPYRVTLRTTDHEYHAYSVPVDEVGPWNEDDNYWNAADGDNPRRMFSDVPLGIPQAEYAYYHNHNGGNDQFGRTVTNPAGVDLTPDVASELGLELYENAFIQVWVAALP